MLEAKCAFLFYCFSQQRFLGSLVDWREDPKLFVIGTPLISIYYSNAVFLYLIAVINYLAMSE